MKRYDYVIIGSGAGLMTAQALANAGFSCAIVEKDKFGGTCLTKGCIPSKMLVYPADLIREAEQGTDLGVHFGKANIDWDKISKRVWEQIDHNKQIEQSLQQMDNLDVYKGKAEFLDAHTMQIQAKDNDTQVISSEHFIIAAGSRTFVPDIEGLEDASYVTAESFFGEKYPKAPYKSLAIIGAGAIGAEFAHIFASLGTKVTLIERAPSILIAEEPDISKLVHEQFLLDKIQVHTNTDTLNVKVIDGMKHITLLDRQSKEIVNVQVEEIFVSAGVKSNADLIAAHKAGIKLDNRAYIITDEYLQTNVQHIFALGDINGKYQFRHTANKEAEIVLHNILMPESPKQSMDYDKVPWAIFTHPQVGHAGLTEEQVKQKYGNDYRVGIYHYSDVVAGIAMGYKEGMPTDGFVKLIVDNDDKILGAHIAGPQASVLIQSYVYLMQNDTYRTLDEAIVIHPSLSEVTAWITEEIE